MSRTDYLASFTVPSVSPFWDFCLSEVKAAIGRKISLLLLHIQDFIKTKLSGYDFKFVHKDFLSLSTIIFFLIPFLTTIFSWPFPIMDFFLDSVSIKCFFF